MVQRCSSCLIISDSCEALSWGLFSESSVSSSVVRVSLWPYFSGFFVGLLLLLLFLCAAIACIDGCSGGL